MRALAVFLACCVMLAAAPTTASFIMCNRTKQALEAAFARRDDNRWVSEGWWRIVPQQCLKIADAPLTQRFYYYFARSTDYPLRMWGGKYTFCSDKQPFTIVDDNDCQARDYESLGFAQIDVGERSEFVLDFRE